jgi:hypothetical protein
VKAPDIVWVALPFPIMANRKPVPRTGRPNLPRVDNPSSDLLWGAEAIAARINRRVGDVYRMHAQRRLPTTVVGGLLVAKKSELSNPAYWPRPAKWDDPHE